MTTNKEFSEKTIDPNPFRQFKKWNEEHRAFNIAIPNSVSLATSTKEGKVSLRTVLLKDYKIEIPSVVENKISKTVQIHVDVAYKK